MNGKEVVKGLPVALGIIVSLISGSRQIIRFQEVLPGDITISVKMTLSPKMEG